MAIALDSDAHGTLFLVQQGSHVLVDASYVGPVPDSELDELVIFLGREKHERVVLDVSQDTPRQTVQRFEHKLRAEQIEVSFNECLAGKAPERSGRVPAMGCNDGESCFQRGVAYFSGAEPKPDVSEDDLWKAVRFFVAACNTGHQRACNAAGNMYRRGWGVRADVSLATSLYRRACTNETTTPEACHNLRRSSRESAESGL